MLRPACDTVRGEVSLQPRHKVAVLHRMREDCGGRVRPLVHVLGERRLGLVAEALPQFRRGCSRLLPGTGSGEKTVAVGGRQAEGFGEPVYRVGIGAVRALLQVLERARAQLRPLSQLLLRQVGGASIPPKERSKYLRLCARHLLAPSRLPRSRVRTAFRRFLRTIIAQPSHYFSPNFARALPGVTRAQGAR